MGSASRIVAVSLAVAMGGCLRDWDLLEDPTRHDAASDRATPRDDGVDAALDAGMDGALDAPDAIALDAQGDIASDRPTADMPSVCVPAGDASLPVGWPNDLTATDALLVSDVPWDTLAVARWSHSPGIDPVVVGDPTAPRSPCNVLEFPYGAGASGGIESCGVPAGALGPYHEIYLGLVWRVDPAWQQPSGDTTTFVYVNQPRTGGGASSIALQLAGPTGARFRIVVDTIPRTAGPLGSNQPLPVDQTAIVPGRWYLFELHARAASTAGSDGLIEWWIDGALVARYTSLALPADAFGNVAIDPTAPDGATVHWMHFDEVRVSVAQAHH